MRHPYSRPLVKVKYLKDIVKKLATELIWEKIYPERKVEVLSVKSEL